MSARQAVRVTYARKRRRAKAVNRMQSSPLEVLPPDRDDITRSEMTRRMLKRSRRAALAEQNEERNVERALLRERLAKRIKRTEEYTMNVAAERNTEPLDAPFPQDELNFQTPFPTEEYMHESSISRPLVPENLSPVPVAKRILPRTSSRNLKENNMSCPLSSPFHSRPGSAASSPKKKVKGKSLRASRISLRGVSRTLSGVLKENSRRISRKDSTMSLNENIKCSHAKPMMHQRYPSSPSTPYMRSRSVQQDWLAPPKGLPRTLSDRDLSPRESVVSTSSFFNGIPQFCSTPPVSRARRTDREAPSDASDQPRPTVASGVHDADVQMTDDIFPRRQTIHISGNSIFSSSAEFSLGPLPGTVAGQVDSISHSSRHVESPNQESGPGGNRPGGVGDVPILRQLARTCIGEYVVPLRALTSSPPPEVAIPNHTPSGSTCIRKVSVGDQTLVLLSTSSPAPYFGPAVSGNARSQRAQKLVTITPPASPVRSPSFIALQCPSSDLVRDMSSLDICVDGAETHSDEEIPRETNPNVLQTRSHSLDGSVATTEAKKVTSKRKPARDRAGTIRASDFVRPNPSVPATSRGSTVAGTSKAISCARRTRSGTVVGPNSKLANVPAPACNPATRAKVPVSKSAPEAESDDEVLLKSCWIEDFEYLGLPAPEGWKQMEVDELNLGGLWDGEERGPPGRPGLRRR
ncbi:hypothetical protein F5I97DRAFT_1967275 [Phlebopus sp. FC_14]|nr:hypothetical protein F5I97DRAFT_1967275 [Phlebopus sp. FC_14]